MNALTMLHAALAATEPAKFASHAMFEYVKQHGGLTFKSGRHSGWLDLDGDGYNMQLQLPGYFVEVVLDHSNPSTVWLQTGHKVVIVELPSTLVPQQALKFIIGKCLTTWKANTKLQGILAGPYAQGTMRGPEKSNDALEAYARDIPGLYVYRPGVYPVYRSFLLKIDKNAKAVYDALVTKIIELEIWGITVHGREMPAHLLSAPRDRDLYFQSVLRSAAGTRQATAAAEPTGGHLEHLWDELTRRGSFKFKIDGCEVEAKLDHRTGVLRAVTGKQYPAYSISVFEGTTLSFFRVFYRKSEDVVEIDGSDDKAPDRIDVIEHAASLSDLVKTITSKCRKLMQVGR